MSRHWPLRRLPSQADLHRLAGGPLPGVLALGAGLLLLAASGLADAATASDATMRQVDIGENHFCVVTTGGALACWGDNKMGQIGNGQVEGRALKPTLVFDSRVAQVSTGYAHTCAVIDDALHCWGWNFSGQLGTGTAGSPLPLPRKVIERGVRSVSAGGMHTCAVVSGGLQCWGYNRAGQIGNGTVGEFVLAPATVLAGGVDSHSSGSQHSCAVVRGALLCWGENRSGQIGNGAVGDPVPTPVVVIPAGVTAVAAGGDTTCAVADGALWCWGRFDEAGIGPNARSVVARPRKLIASGVSAVALGSAHACAIVRGALHCWGYNSVGGIGSGAWGEQVASPREVIAAGVTAVAAGQFNTCVIVDRALRCRGHSPHGQIPAMAAFESKPFALAGGDVASPDLAAASAMAAAAIAPRTLGNALVGRIVVPEDGGGIGAAYQVSGGRASTDIHGVLQLELDVFPLQRLARGKAEAEQPVVTSAAACGADSALLPNRLTTTRVHVLDGNRLVGLPDFLAPSFKALPDVAGPGSPLRIAASTADSLQSCARSILEAAARRPFIAARYEMNGQLFDLPPTLDGSWSLSSAQSTGSLTRIVVEPRPGRAGRFSVEVAVGTVMQCGEVALDGWKDSPAKPWRVPGNGTAFEIERQLIDEDVPDYPRHTPLELQRALAAARKTAALPSLDEITACQRVATGEHVVVRHDGQVVQRLGLAYPAARPIAPDGCAGRASMAALHAANNLGYTVMGVPGFARCKPLPDDPTRQILVFAYADDAAIAASTTANPNDVGEYDLGVLIAERGSGHVHSRYLKKKALTSDAWRLADLAIDTARYRLAAGVRAFGLRVSHEGSSRVSPAGSQRLDLFVERGGRIEPVLSGLQVSMSNGEWDGQCQGQFSETTRTVGVAASSTHGFADLAIGTTTRQRSTVMVGSECQEKAAPPQRSQVLLRFDGRRYPVPPELAAP